MASLVVNAAILNATSGLHLRVSICISGSEEVKLPYYYCMQQCWRVRSSDGSMMPYRGPKRRMQSPEAKEAHSPGEGWIVLSPGATHHEDVNLNYFAKTDATQPFKYELRGTSVVVV